MHKLPVLMSTSTKSTVAPHIKGALAEATKEIGEVQTISPAPTFNAKQAKWRDEVALLEATEPTQPILLVILL